MSRGIPPRARRRRNTKHRAHLVPHLLTRKVIRSRARRHARPQLAVQVILLKLVDLLQVQAERFEECPSLLDVVRLEPVSKEGELAAEEAGTEIWAAMSASLPRAQALALSLSLSCCSMIPFAGFVVQTGTPPGRRDSPSAESQPQDPVPDLVPPPLRPRIHVLGRPAAQREVLLCVCRDARLDLGVG